MVANTRGDVGPAKALRQLIAGSGAAFVIYDLEVTSWEGALARRWSGPGEFPEILQIGAVRLAGTAGHTELAVFNQLVRPVRNPVLSDYIVNLTGITQAEVDATGVSFAEALHAFARFAAGCRALSNGADDEHLAVNCRLHDLASPFQPSDLVNISPHLRRAFGRTAHISSYELPALSGWENPGRAHEALADARAVAMAVRHTLGSVA